MAALLKTPAALRYRMPAEWEPHAATWLSWPRREGISFPDSFDRVLPALRAISRCPSFSSPNDFGRRLDRRKWRGRTADDGIVSLKSKSQSKFGPRRNRATPPRLFRHPGNSLAG